VARFSVLLVDDEDDVRAALRRALLREGWELHQASSGAEALTILALTSIDLVVTDQRMPGMTGLELIRIIKEKHPDVMRVVLTGYGDFETIQAAVNEAEIYRFLTKPWDDLDLRLTLRSALELRALERDNRRLLALIRRQEMLLTDLERTHPGITQVERDESGAIIISDHDDAAGSIATIGVHSPRLAALRLARRVADELCGPSPSWAVSR
jgi:YesN/AraC family two-component response regulator